MSATDAAGIDRLQTALRGFAGRPSGDTFATLCQVAATGLSAAPAAQRELKATLLATGLEIGLGDDELREVINRTVPGPTDFDPAVPIAMDSTAAPPPTPTNALPRTHEASTEISLLTTAGVPGWDVVAVHGIVTGSTIRTRHVGAKLAASGKALVGGELQGMSRMLDEARTEALQRLRSAAAATGGNAVLSVRLATSEVFEGAAEVCAYGTAVTLRRDPAT